MEKGEGLEVGKRRTVKGGKWEKGGKREPLWGRVIGGIRGRRKG